jgi:hypothetical protein
MYRPDQDSADYKAGYEDGLEDGKPPHYKQEREVIEIAKKWRNLYDNLEAGIELEEALDALERLER